jgi:hypothetical protein
MLNDTCTGVGVGFYISSTKVISCSHHYPSLKDVDLADAKQLSFWGKNFEGNRMKLFLLVFQTNAIMMLLCLKRPTVLFI